jgi:hypothetical protein
MTDESEIAKQSQSQYDKGPTSLLSTSDATRLHSGVGKRNVRSATGNTDNSQSIEAGRAHVRLQDQNLKDDPQPEVREHEDVQGGDCPEMPSTSHHKYFYTERERYLPLANISRSVKDVVNHAMPGRNIRISKEGELQTELQPVPTIPSILGLIFVLQQNSAFKKSQQISSS